MSALSVQDRKSFEQELYLLTKSVVGNAVLATIDEAQLTAMADRFYDRDVHQCKTIARRALTCIPTVRDIDADARAFVKHMVWYTWRTALWKSGIKQAATWTYQGLSHFIEVKGQPIVIVTPTMIPLCDVIDLMAAIMPDVPVVVYGEAIGDLTRAHNEIPKNIQVIGNDIGGLECLLPVLLNGGVFCTYPDFVYEGHNTVECKMFGVPRKVSSSFVSICTKPEVKLLPLCLSYANGEFRAVAREAVQLEFSGQRMSRQDKKRCILQFIISVLEAAIAQTPDQWIALGTLAAEVTTSTMS